MWECVIKIMPVCMCLSTAALQKEWAAYLDKTRSWHKACFKTLCYRWNTLIWHYVILLFIIMWFYGIGTSIVEKTHSKWQKCFFMNYTKFNSNKTPIGVKLCYHIIYHIISFSYLSLSLSHPSGSPSPRLCPLHPSWPEKAPPPGSDWPRWVQGSGARVEGAVPHSRSPERRSPGDPLRRSLEPGSFLGVRTYASPWCWA